MEHPIKAVIFDIDGTVTPDSNSWLRMTRDLGASVEEHKRIFFEGFKQGSVSYDSVREQLTKMWRATGKATRQGFQDMFDSWPIIPEAQDLIDYLRAKNVHVAFITGATGMYAKIVADKFGVTDFYANGQLQFDDQDNLIDFHYPLDESERKVDHLIAYCEAKSILPQEVVALGDGDNEIAIFKATGRGIMVGPDKPAGLKAVAWKQTDSITDVKALLVPYLGN